MPDDSAWQIAKRISSDAVRSSIADYAPQIAESCHDLGLEATSLLVALATVESQMGTHLDREDWHIARRHEPSYCHSGKYYDGALTELWGCKAHCSYGPWQIMYLNAVRYGFPASVDPEDKEDGLLSVRVAADITTRMLLHELHRVAGYRRGNPLDTRSALEMVGCTWNGGNPTARTTYGYVRKLREAYDADRRHRSAIPDSCFHGSPLSGGA